MNAIAMEAPPIVVVTEADVQPALTPLGIAIRNRIDFEFGWNLCHAYQPVDLCENDSQRNGWWAYLDAEAFGMLPAKIQRSLEE